MSEVFALEDLFNVMIELETLGHAHYGIMVGMTDNEDLKKLFKKLSDAELAHKVLYQKFKTDFILYNQEEIDEEYKGYMDALLDRTIGFLKTNQNLTSFEAGFDLAVQLEKDTILFLNEVRSLVSPNHHGQIDAIIVQERGHLKALNDYLRTEGKE